MIPEGGAPRPQDLESALRIWGRERERSLVAHPNVDQLARYDQMRLDADEQEAIEEHLTYCSDCATLLLELPGLLGEHETAPPEPLAFPSLRRSSLTSWLSRPRVAQRALAASLVLSVVAVAWALVEASRPRQDGEIRFFRPSVEIFADGARRDPVPKVEFPPTGGPLLLSFRLPSVEEPWPTEAAAMLFGPNDRVLYRVSSVHLDRSTNLEMSLGTRALSPGVYRVELHSVGLSSRRMLVRFRFELVQR